MKTKTTNIKFNVSGAAEAKRKIDALTKSVESFFKVGKKYKIPRPIVIKMLRMQVTRDKKTIPL
jgi:hypothetical protein